MWGLRSHLRRRFNNQAISTDPQIHVKTNQTARLWWWCTPLILALRRRKQVDFCEFEANLIYRVSPRTARATRRSSVTDNNKSKTKNKTQTVVTSAVVLSHVPVTICHRCVPVTHGFRGISVEPEDSYWEAL